MELTQTVIKVDLKGSYAMAYDSQKMFSEIERQLSVDPSLQLHELARLARCSHPTIEKAVLKHSGLSFRNYKKRRLLEMGISYLADGHKVREIGSLMGYKWSENYLRLVKSTAGCSLRKLGHSESIMKKTRKAGQ